MFKKIATILVALFLVGCSPSPTVLHVKQDSTKVILSWIAPTEYTDGTPLPIDVIQGYKVYIGTASKIYKESVIDIKDKYTTEVDVSSLVPNTYYAVVVCYTQIGESGYSNEVSFTTQ